MNKEISMRNNKIIQLLPLSLFLSLPSLSGVSTSQRRPWPAARPPA